MPNLYCYPKMFWLTSTIGVAKVVVVKMIVARTSDIAAILTAIFLVQNRCAAQGRLNWGCRSSQCINRGLLLWRTSSDGVHSLEKKLSRRKAALLPLSSFLLQFQNTIFRRRSNYKRIFYQMGSFSKGFWDRKINAFFVYVILYPG